MSPGPGLAILQTCMWFQSIEMVTLVALRWIGMAGSLPAGRTAPEHQGVSLGTGGVSSLGWAIGVLVQAHFTTPYVSNVLKACSHAVVI